MDIHDRALFISFIGRHTKAEISEELLSALTDDELRQWGAQIIISTGKLAEKNKSK
jgi:hypothetical protein